MRWVSPWDSSSIRRRSYFTRSLSSRSGAEKALSAAMTPPIMSVSSETMASTAATSSSECVFGTEQFLKVELALLGQLRETMVVGLGQIRAGAFEKLRENVV